MKSSVIKGKALVLGDNIDTDVIYPGIYLPIIDADEMAEHALEGISLDISGRLREQNVIVAGKNFGCGSSREQAATSLAVAGVKAILAVSFARIFYRNAINQGIFPLIVKKKLGVEDEAEIEIDFKKSEIKWDEGRSDFQPLPDFLLEIVMEGGLLPYTKKRLS